MSCPIPSRVLKTRTQAWLVYVVYDKFTRTPFQLVLCHCALQADAFCSPLTGHQPRASSREALKADYTTIMQQHCSNCQQASLGLKLCGGCKEAGVRRHSEVRVERTCIWLRGACLRMRVPATHTVCHCWGLGKMHAWAYAWVPWVHQAISCHPAEEYSALSVLRSILGYPCCQGWQAGPQGWHAPPGSSAVIYSSAAWRYSH